MYTHTAIAFDTHSFVKRLKSVGFTEEQSEVFAEEQARIIDERLAAKQDTKEIDVKIESVRSELKRDIKELDAKIESVRMELKRDMKELEYRAVILVSANRFGSWIHLIYNLLEKLEISGFPAEMPVTMAETRITAEYRMTMKLGTLMVVAVGAVAALVKLL